MVSPGWRRAASWVLERNHSHHLYAVLAEATRAAGVRNIITRNTKDFVGCGLAVFTPMEWLANAM